jgi:hypothetical protein
MTPKKILIMLTGLLLLCSIIGLIDMYLLDNDGLGLTFAVGALIAMLAPVAILITLLFATYKILKGFATNQTNSNEKQGMLKRLFIALFIAVVAVCLYGIINAIGTRFIDI